MNNVDIGRYSKRIMQYIWDPEPQNDQEPTMPIWCLGEKYITHSTSDALVTDYGEQVLANGHEQSHGGNRHSAKSESDQTPQIKRQEDQATHHSTTHHGWPEEFLRDFESKVWMTYRYNFHPIPRSDDRDQSLTLRVRIRNQLVDSQGFTSDTGWGCMIRSGQSLLANTLLLLHLDRGTNCEMKRVNDVLLTTPQIGDMDKRSKKKRKYCVCSWTIQMHHSQYTNSSNMAPSPVVSTRGNGSGPRQQLDV